MMTARMTTDERVATAELLARLNGNVAVKQRALIEARVMLGFIVLGLREKFERRDVEDVVDASNIHRRRLSEAVRLAEHFANPDGSVAWQKYRAMCAAKGHAARGDAPSVRSMIGLVRPEGAAVVEDVDDDLVELPDVVYEDSGPDADAAFDDDLVDLPDVVYDDEQERASMESLEVRALEATAGRVMGNGGAGGAGGAAGVAGVGRGAWAVGPQLSMESLYQRATGLADDLERVLGSMFVDASELLGPVRARLALQTH